MDSKVIRFTIAVFISLTALILVIVYAANADKIQKLFNGSAADSAISDESAAEFSVAFGEQIGNQLQGFMTERDFFDEPDALSSIYSEDVTAVSLELKAGDGSIKVSIKNGRGGLETGEHFEVLLTRHKDSSWEKGDDEDGFVQGIEDADAQDSLEQGIADADAQDSSMQDDEDANAGDSSLADTDEDEPAIYTDDNRDGQILIEDLRVGFYTVTLQPKDGYHVPSYGSSVQVVREAETTTSRISEDASSLQGTSNDAAVGGTSLQETTAVPKASGISNTDATDETAGMAATLDVQTNDAGLDSSAMQMQQGKMQKK